MSHFQFHLVQFLVLIGNERHKDLKNKIAVNSLISFTRILPNDLKRSQQKLQN